jgi:dephospho-CoA kinase
MSAIPNKRLIGISGKIGSGKDTIYSIIRGFGLTNKQTSWENKKFAGKLKEIASILTGISQEKFEDQEFKQTILGPEWGTPTKSNVLNSIEPFKDITFLEMMSVRELLQKIGTEAMRNGLHENVWVNALFSDYKEDSLWVITDVRFPNEYKAIKEKEGIVIRVERPNSSSKKKEITQHPSEIGLDNFDFDYTIHNDSTLENLVSKVREILKKENII